MEKPIGKIMKLPKIFKDNPVIMYASIAYVVAYCLIEIASIF